MAGIKDIAQGRSDLYRVSPYDLEIKPDWNSRDPNDPSNAEHIDSLAKSIAEVGVKQPLTIYAQDGKFYVEDGHCRLAACIRAINHYGASKEMTIPVRMGDKEAGEQDRVLSQIVRNSGKPLSPLEMGTVFKKLRDLGMSDTEIAKHATVSRVYVGMLIGLVDMPASITDLVRSGAVSATLAIETVKDCGGDAEKAAAMLQGAVETAKANGKERATAKHVKQAKEGEEKPKGEKKPTLRTRLREAFNRADIDGLGNGPVTVTFTRAEWEEIATVVGLDREEEEEGDII